MEMSSILQFTPLVQDLTLKSVRNVHIGEIWKQI